MVHGDDFTALGWEAELDWYRGILTRKFDAKVKGADRSWDDGREINADLESHDSLDRVGHGV